MLDRARLFTSSELQNEKMISLGKLSAGLAIERCAAMLEGRLKDSEEAARDLAGETLNDEQIATVEAVRRTCMANKLHEARSTLEQCDREEAIEAWLAGHGLDTANAQMLADTEVTFEVLELLAAGVERTALNAVLRWRAAGCAVRNLTSKIQESAIRVSNLVNAVKGFTHMDQANVAEPVDLGSCLANTVTVLRSKAREKLVEVTLELEGEVPKVRGFAAELNRVWGNLIDNALDATSGGGRVQVLAHQEDQSVVVRILDDGAGVPAEIRDRIFDPFFTTKPMGQGTGLGLDIARRLVRHNDGAIASNRNPAGRSFESRCRSRRYSRPELCDN
jgi:signal transduction histidine kinase